MKKLIFSILVTLFAATTYCQTSSLEQAIKKGLAQLDSVKSMSDMQAVVNQFQRIALAEPNKWEPLYHLAYTQILMSFWEKDGETKDKILDQAEADISKAMELNGDKSELYTLQGFLYQGRIQVNATRGMTYSLKASEFFGKAIEENPENPRALFLIAQNIYYSPKMYGGGCANALPKYLEAKEKFEKESGKSGIGPGWGAKSNLNAIEKCNNEIGNIEK
jgi:cytochrome c-type biogenesis protein CcmH/NrfG